MYTEVFFEMTFTFALGPIPMVVFIEGVGGAGMYWSIGKRFLFCLVFVCVA